MSFNSPASAAGYVATFLDTIQQYVAASPGRAILIAILYTPVLTVVLNILRQLVSIQSPPLACQLTYCVQIIPRDPSLPPEVFHWIPIIGSAISYGKDPLNFFFKCREKVRW